MRSYPLLTGLAAALVSIVLVFGSLSLSLAEGLPVVAPTPTPTQTEAFTATVAIPTGTPSPSPTNPPPATPTPTRTSTPTASLTPTSTTTAIPSPSITSTLAPCAQPPGWTTYTVVVGDYLSQIAYRFHTTLADLRRVNCLGNSSVIHPGDILYVPESGSSTSTPGLTSTPTGTNPNASSS